MAEAWCRHLRGDAIEARSAGIERHGLNPRAVRVMREIGIDISDRASKSLDDLDTRGLDFVVTVCSHAHETCPVFPGRAQVIHRGFDDPPKLAERAADEEEALSHYRRVRDEIRDYILTLPDALRDTRKRPRRDSKRV